MPNAHISSNWNSLPLQISLRCAFFFFGLLLAPLCVCVLVSSLNNFIMDRNASHFENRFTFFFSSQWHSPMCTYIRYMRSRSLSHEWRVYRITNNQPDSRFLRRMRHITPRAMQYSDQLLFIYIWITHIKSIIGDDGEREPSSAHTRKHSDESRTQLLTDVTNSYFVMCYWFLKYCRSAHGG